MLFPSLLWSPQVPRGHSRDYVSRLPWPHLTWSLFALSSVALSGIILSEWGQPSGSRQLTSFRCPGQTASRKADAEMLMLIVDTGHTWWLREVPSSSLYRVLNSPLGSSRCQVHPRNPDWGVYFKEVWKRAGRLEDKGILIIWEFISFQSFSDLYTEVAGWMGREAGELLVDGQLCACSGLGTDVIFSNPHRLPARLGLSPSTLQRGKLI